MSCLFGFMPVEPEQFHQGIHKICYLWYLKVNTQIGLPSEKHFRNHLLGEPITHLKASYLIKFYIRIFQGVTFGK